MLSKIVVKNIGLLRAFDTPNAPKLDKLTLFYGRNGRGKSTLTSILRAARDGEAATVLGRQSLGNGGAAPKVVLISSAGRVIFEEGSWNPKGAPIEIFDTTFITDNVYAGELIDLVHDRGLFSIIIGEDGVRLANHLTRFNGIAKRCATTLNDAEAALANDLPTDLSKEEFFQLGPDPNYADRLESAERALKAVQKADRIAALKPLEVLTLPEPAMDLAGVLTSTVADIDASARMRLLNHFKRFGLDKKGEAWIGYGIEHIHDDACPFCGQDKVDSEGLVTLYGQIFSETYKAHLSTITMAALELEKRLGEDARMALAGKIYTNAEMLAKWGEFVAVGRDFPDMSELGSHIADAYKGAKLLFDRKRSSPLDVIEAANDLALVEKSLAAARKLLDQYNDTLVAINEITRAAVAAAPTTVADATIAVNNIKRRIARYDPGVQKRVNAYLGAKRRDKRARDMRTLVQKRLKKANEDAAEHYHKRANYYLDRFGASFSISKITSNMQGNTGQADYGLLIKGEAIARGRGRPTDAIPTFRNTLSAGDKTTLAFAFFLAKLDHDRNLACKTLVIDDPLSSHDSHRRRETVNAIKDLCGRCRQVIVLSHDEYLLREIERRCVGVPCAAFQIDFTVDDGWSAASAVDLDQLCRAEHVRLVEEVVSFVDKRKGDPNHIVHNIRRVIETHYRRSYSAYFARDRNLGQIIRDISEAGVEHPCYRDLGRLDNCNDATCEKHHGDDAMVIVKQGIDPDSLRVIAIDALELIGARRPTHSTVVPLARSCLSVEQRA